MPRKPAEFTDHPVGFDTARDRGLLRGVCRHVVDGDTADFFVDLGFHQYAYISLRFFGVDTPELRGTTGVVKQRAEEARDRVVELMGGRPVLLRSQKGSTFGRFLGDIWFPAADDAFAPLAQTIDLGPDGGGRWASIVEVLVAEKRTAADAEAEAQAAG